MDFELHYSGDQEDFRKEVRAWLDTNIPKGFEDTVSWDGNKVTEEQFFWAREFQRKLGQKGWLAPTHPKEYGGGGLSMSHAVVIEEELSERRLPGTGNLGISLFSPAMLAWGTEEQKQKYLVPIFRGEAIVWQLFTEPEAGSDLASLKTRAVEDGDDFVINGSKIFVGEKWYADYLYTATVTDPNAPRHQNLGAFLIPADTPGITFQHLDLIGGGGKRAIFFEDVRVSKENLIGGKTQGWAVVNSTLDVEHGGGGRLVTRNRIVDLLLKYCKETKRNGQRISEDPIIRDTLVNLHIDAHVAGLFAVRNYWMRNAGKRFSYEGPQSSLYGKMFSPRLGTAVLQAVGPLALLDDPELAPLRGEFENHQRQSIITHPGGTPEIQKVVMARNIGISRTRGAH